MFQPMIWGLQEHTIQKAKARGRIVFEPPEAIDGSVWWIVEPHKGNNLLKQSLLELMGKILARPRQAQGLATLSRDEALEKRGRASAGSRRAALMDEWIVPGLIAENDMRYLSRGLREGEETALRRRGAGGKMLGGAQDER